MPLLVSVLLGNKCDLEDQRQVEESEARTLADSLGLKYFETSAATGVNVNKAVAALLDQVGTRATNTNVLHSLRSRLSVWFEVLVVAPLAQRRTGYTGYVLPWSQLTQTPRKYV